MLRHRKTYAKPLGTKKVLGRKQEGAISVHKFAVSIPNNMQLCMPAANIRRSEQRRKAPIASRSVRHGHRTRKMDTEVTIGLGLLTLVFATLAISLTTPENRIPFAIHIVFVNGCAYIIANLR